MAEMTRRTFVGAAACGAAALAAAVPGVALGDAAAAPEPEAWDETVVRPEILEKPDIQYVRSE